MKIFHINISGINHREEVALILFRSIEKFRALRGFFSYCCSKSFWRTVRHSYIDILAFRSVNRLARLEWQCPSAYPCSQEHFHWRFRQLGQLLREMQTQKLFWCRRRCYSFLWTRCRIQYVHYIGLKINYQEELTARVIIELLLNEDQPSIIVLYGSLDDFQKIAACRSLLFCHKGLNFICEIAKTSWF